MNVLYEGFFITTTLESTLEKDIEYKHVTVAFQPTKTHEHLYGKCAIFKAIGYGNNGVNEGLRVKMISCEDDELQELFNALEVPHITLSISNDGFAINTRYLDFSQDSNITVKGIFGAFIDEKPIFA